MVSRARFFGVVAFAAAVLFAAAGCATPEGFALDDVELHQATQTVSSEASSAAPVSTTQTPEPTPIPSPSQDEILAAITATDILSYIPPNTYVAEEGQKWYEPVISQEEVTLALPNQYQAWLDDATANLSFEGVSRIETQLEAPAWPMLAAIAANYQADPDGMREALIEAGGIESSAEETEDGYIVTITAHQADPQTLFTSLPESPATNAFSLLMSYAYLSTVFDEGLHGRSGIGEPELEELLFPIARADRYYVGDTWGDARDQGGRRHTGCDINAPEGTDLLACVDGTIIYNGSDRVAGNYIVLQGADGTQYHYYHMVTPSDVPVGTVVERGDVIGHVGNTGNSRANHLHFTIVTSDGHFLNPVHYLQRAQRDTISGAIVSTAEARAAAQAQAEAEAAAAQAQAEAEAAAAQAETEAGAA